MSSALETSSLNGSTMKVNCTQRLKISGNYFACCVLTNKRYIIAYNLVVCILSAFRKACSLDVEISASGYTKELQQDDQLLHPVGPEGEENLSGDEDDAPEAPQPVCEESIDMEEYKHAILELEGLKIGKETSSGGKYTEEQHGETSSEKEICSDRSNDLVTDSSRRLESNEELEENEDECPDLVDLSAYNKVFKPFR